MFMDTPSFLSDVNESTDFFPSMHYCNQITTETKLLYLLGESLFVHNVISVVLT